MRIKDCLGDAAGKILRSAPGSYPLSGGRAVGSGKKKSVLPFAWGTWNCFVPEVYKLGVGRERGQTLESKSHFQSCLNHRDLEAEADPSDELHREEAKASSFLRRGGVGHGRMVGWGWGLAGPWFGPQDAAKVPGS